LERDSASVVFLSVVSNRKLGVGVREVILGSVNEALLDSTLK
jgi:hypothetical protein